MADPIRYLRLNAIPLVWLSDAQYFIATGPNTFDLYVTGNDAIPRRVGAGADGADGPQGAPGLQGVPGQIGQTGVRITAIEALGGHRAVTVLGQYANPGDENILAGITTAAVVLGGVTYAVREGVITEPSWSWIPNQPLFIASSGVLTQSPTTSRIRRVAWALTATSINVDFYSAIELI